MAKDAEKSKRLQDAVLQELAAKKPAPSSWPWPPLTRALNRIRAGKGLTRAYSPPSLATPTPDLSTLTADEQARYAAFKKCRQQHTELSYYYAQQYKASYVLNYRLAVFAVSLAVVSLGIMYGIRFAEHTILESAGKIVVFALGVLKLLCLLVIYVNTRQADHNDFNDRAIIYRYLLEQLRYMMFTPLLGIYRLAAPSLNRTVLSALRDNYLEIYLRDTVAGVRATLQEGGKAENTAPDYDRLPPILRFIQQEWVGPQIAYHADKHEKQLALDEQLDKRVDRLNLVVLIAVAVDVACGIVAFTGVLGEHFHDVVTALILIAATIIPAAVASFNALRFQTEARRLADRSEAMVGLLSSQEAAYDRLIKDISEASEKPSDLTARATKLLSDTAQIMVDEVTEWTFIYSNLVMDQ